MDLLEDFFELDNFLDGSFTVMLGGGYVLLCIVGLALIFHKAGVVWWKALIPFYKRYVLAECTVADEQLVKSVKQNVIAEAIVDSGLLFMMAAFLYDCFDSEAIFILAVFVGIVVDIWKLFLDYRVSGSVAKAFGYPDGWRFGFWLLPGIFMFLAGIDADVKFLGKK